MFCETRFGLESVASCQETNGYEKSIGYGNAAVVGRNLAHRRPDPEAGLQVVGPGGLGVRPRSDGAGVRQVRLGEDRSERFIGVGLLLGGAFTAIEGLVRLLFVAVP